MTRRARLREVVSEFFRALATKEFVQHTTRERGQLERMLILLMMGDTLGIPIIRPYYALRLVPFLWPHLELWKRSLLRERDLADALS